MNFIAIWQWQWHRIMANRLPSLLLAIHIIHFHSRFYDIFFSAGITLSHVLAAWFSLFFAFALSRSIFCSICLDFHHFSMRSWLTVLCTLTLTLYDVYIYTWIHCVWFSLPLYFLFSLCVRACVCVAVFSLLATSFSYSKTQVIFHLCALLFIRSTFVCFISCCCCCCHSSDLNLSSNTSATMAATTHTHIRSSNVYHSTIFSFWYCTSKH